MHLAAQNDQPRMLAWLLMHGLDINSRDIDLNTPLHWACFQGAKLSVSFLLVWGALLDATNIKG